MPRYRLPEAAGANVVRSTAYQLPTAKAPALSSAFALSWSGARAYSKPTTALRSMFHRMFARNADFKTRPICWAFRAFSEYKKDRASPGLLPYVFRGDSKIRLRPWWCPGCDNALHSPLAEGPQTKNFVKPVT